MNPMDFADRLKAIRKEKGLTQRELADIIKSNNNTLSNWEKRVSHPTMPVVESLAKALKVSPFDLIGDFTLGELRTVLEKDYRERTPEENMALTFSGPLVFKMNLQLDDLLTPEQEGLSARVIDEELNGFGPLDYLLDDGGHEVLVAYNDLTFHARTILLDYLTGLLKVPSYLKANADAEDLSKIIRLERIRDNLASSIQEIEEN
jgi:transcriptional regulator with XRE-family HTH domain